MPPRLERTVTQFGFKGAMVNGHMHERFLDDLCFAPILEWATALDVPIYIHPTPRPTGSWTSTTRTAPTWSGDGGGRSTPGLIS
jgi:predicted TIM-barrel fold metal-dependent hydrolase